MRSHSSVPAAVSVAERSSTQTYASADAEPVSIGEDAHGNSVHYTFGNEDAVRFSSPRALSTHVTFSKPGTYRIRLNASDGMATGYHTLFIEVRK